MKFSICKKLITVVLTILILLGSMPVTAFAESDILYIQAGECLDVEIGEEDELLIQFEPEKSDSYTFYSVSDYGDPVGYLYDSEMNLIVSDDDSGEFSDFSIICNLDKGSTYYYAVKLWSIDTDDDTCKFKVFLCNHTDVLITEDEPECTGNGYEGGIYCNVCSNWIYGHDKYAGRYHINTSYYAEEQKSQCISYTEGTYCSDCKSWIDGHEEILSHTDVDNDRYCDVCGEAAIYGKGYKGENITWTLYLDGTLEVTGYGDMFGHVNISWENVALYVNKISISEGITNIGASAFKGCKNLKEVIIPQSVRKIDYGAFADCYYLKKILIPSNVEIIDQEAFSGCYWIEDITILNPDCIIADNILTADFFEGTIYGFENSTAQAYAEKHGLNFKICCLHENTIEYAQQNSTCYVNGYTAGVYCSDCELWISGHEIIKAMHTDEEKNRICDICGEEALLAEGTWDEAGWKLYFDGVLEVYGTGAVGSIPSEYRSFVEKVKLPYGITAISDFAFNQYVNMKEINIPESVSYIGSYAFIGCGSLESIIIPTGITNIYENTFGSCVKLEKIVIPEGVTSIGLGAFSGCTGLKEVHFPSTIKSISHYNFTDGNNLDVYFNGSEEQWNEVDIYSSNDDLLNSTIHFLGETECTHTNKTVHAQQDATCTADGYTAGEYCPDCEQWLSGHEVIESGHKPSTYTQNASCGVNGYKLTTCTACGETLDYEIIPANQHSFGSWTVTKNATCTVNGEESRKCSACGETETKAITAPGHAWSEWKVTEATLMSAGEKTRACSRCKTEEREVIPKLEGDVSEDAFSGVKVEYTDSSYSGKKMDVVVEEDFTGSQYLGISYGNYVSWNIKTYVDGIEAQPGAPVLVTIPLPEKFNRNSIIVYHVNSVTGTLEKIEPVVIDGDYIKFLATSFSVYMVIDESSVIEEEPSENCSCNCHKSGFMGLIWKIINFFNKLFKINKNCSCGMSHY